MQDAKPESLKDLGLFPEIYEIFEKTERSLRERNYISKEHMREGLSLNFVAGVESLGIARVLLGFRHSSAAIDEQVELARGYLSARFPDYKKHMEGLEKPKGNA